MMRRFSNLPKEILLEILIRLPTESVLECKLVCKLWRDLVRLPSFSQLHLTHLNSADGDSGKFGFMIWSREGGPKSYYTEYDEHFYDTRLYSRETRINNINPLFENITFIGSCNGLICFHSWSIDEKFGKIQNGLTYVCNPVTREYIILPDLERQYLWWYWFGNFGYSCWWYGFGYSSSTDEYKFVSICKSREDLNVVQVYTLGSGWRTVGNMDKNMKQVRECTGAFANGALHWLDEAGTVLSFSLTDEKFSEIPQPPPSLTRDAVPYSLDLKALCGFLGAVFYYDLGHIEIWLLKKNKDNYDLSWSKEFSFSGRIPFPFGFTKSGRLLCYQDKKIYRFDSKASSAKLDLSSGKSIVQAIPHKNTLVSLKVLGEKHTKIMEFGEILRSSEETGNTIN